MGLMLTPENNLPPHMCYLVKFGSSAPKGVYAEIAVNSKVKRAGAPPPLVWDHGWPLEICPSPRVILPNLVVLGQTVRTLLRRSVCKFWHLASRLSRSLEVIDTATDDFLLAFHSNRGSISYRYWDERRFQSCIQGVRIGIKKRTSTLSAFLV